MKVCVFGAGAIGGYVGALLARAGVDVSLVARGPHGAAMRENGLTLHIGGDSFTVRPTVTDDPATLGPQDYVLLTLKAHSLPPIVDKLMPLIGPETAVVTAINGIPWWYGHGIDGPAGGHRLDSVDPGGRIWDTIGPERAIGTVVWQAAEVVAPGVVQHNYGERMPLGEPDGAKTPRAEALSKALISAGIKSPVRPRIRDEIWMKLWGNLSFNPISALTGSTLETIARDPATRAVVARMMEEAKAVGEATGARFTVSVDDRIGMTEKVGAHRTSMLQDLEAGRPMEISALVAAVSELGRLTGLPTPTIDAVLALVSLRAKEAGCLA